MNDMQPSDKTKQMLLMADALDELREMARGFVAGFVADGFTDAQARRIVTHLMAPPVDDAEDKSDREDI